MKYKVLYGMLPMAILYVAISATHTTHGMQTVTSTSLSIFKEMLLTTGKTLASTIKTIGSAVLTKAELKPAIFFICGIVLVCYGSYILGKTILTSGLKIAGSLLLIGVGIAALMASNNGSL